MLSDKKPRLEKYFNPLVVVFSGVNPNLLTLLGSIPPLLFFVFVINKMYVWAMIAFVGTSFDFIDGMVARKYNKVTAFGAFLDSVVDRVGDFLFITAFSFGGIVRWEITAPLLLLSFLTSYIRSRGGLELKNHNEFAVGIIERTERLAILAIALVLHFVFPENAPAGINLSEWSFLVLLLLSGITTLQRILHAHKKL
jgi:phosphatidylglycerophosphate synthase